MVSLGGGVKVVSLGRGVKVAYSVHFTKSLLSRILVYFNRSLLKAMTSSYPALLVKPLANI